jgi:hypothetical protein
VTDCLCDCLLVLLSISVNVSLCDCFCDCLFYYLGDCLFVLLSVWHPCETGKAIKLCLSETYSTVRVGKNLSDIGMV